jgi:hypothetical protein
MAENAIRNHIAACGIWGDIPDILDRSRIAAIRILCIFVRVFTVRVEDDLTDT